MSDLTDHTDPASPSAARLAIDRVWGFLKIARVLIEDGRRVALSGFETEMGLLCAAVLDAGPAQGAALKAELAVLLTQIESVEASLVRAGPLP